MDADRTQHVLDAIDGALEDWTVSEDAMRWTPQPAQPPSSPRVEWVAVSWAPLRRPRQNGRASMHTGGPLHFEWPADLTPWQQELAPWQQRVADVLLQSRHQEIARAFNAEIAGWGGRGVRRTARMAALVEAYVRECREAAERISAASAASAGEVEQLLTVVDQVDNEDPRARALRLRRQRGTGPGRTPAGQQKRPRSLA